MSSHPVKSKKFAFSSQKKRRSRKPKRNLFWRRGLNKISRAITNTEVKIIDTAGTINPGTTANINTINIVDRGTDKTNRIGNSIRMIGVELNIKININASATHSTTRVNLLRDSQSSGLQPTAAQVFTSTSNLMSPINIDQRYRFHMMLFEFVSLSISGAQEQVITYNSPLNSVVRFNGTGGSFGDIVTNALVVLLTSDESTNTPSCLYYARVSFVDD